jgi:NADH:ubiquinone oxidoreductase subunit F (NADH-binding)
LRIFYDPYLLLRHRDIPGLKNIEVYKQNGGFESLKKAVTAMQPKQIVEEVKASGLRGRGGAGFPTGVKWSFLPDTIWPHYVVCNADESEPGTFKDREIMEGNPYQFLEGVAISCFAVGATEGYIYIRGEYFPIAEQIEACIAEMEKQGYLGDKLVWYRNVNSPENPSRRGRLYLRRGNRPARIARRQTRTAAPASAFPGGSRVVWQTDRHQQR